VAVPPLYVKDYGLFGGISLKKNWRTDYMNKQLRRVAIAGNWKMNKNPQEARQLVEAMKPFAAQAACDVIVCVPYVDLSAVVEAARGSALKVGAQNCHWEPSGAFTGEISADMLVSMGVEYVIIGHSERRQFFGDTDITVNKRVKAALKAGLKVILCVGELLEQREQGITSELVALQTKIALGSVTADEMKNIIIAYEPVWAIGTGRTATAQQANEVCATLRGVITALYGKAAADATVVQYGGSMNAANAAELLAQPDIDGGLIGGASLKPADFAVIVGAAG
jgi:triosephosphate isomerase